MSASDEWMDPEAESDEAEATGDNDFRAEDAASDSQDVDAAPDDILAGPDAAAVLDASAGDVSFVGADATPDVAADEPPPDFLESIGPEFPADTLPLLDASGNTPADFDALYRALVQWEAAAADAPGDPRFTPKPTTKERNELLMLDRGPTVPVVWLDRATMTPVKYSGEKPPSLRDELPPIDEPPDSETGDRDLKQGMSRPVLVVRVHRAGRHFQNAFEARSERWLRIMGDIAQERVEYERWCQACEERAINGDY